MAYNGEGKCAECGTIAQRFKGPDGKFYCWDCYYKVWGEYPKE